MRLKEHEKGCLFVLETWERIRRAYLKMQQISNFDYLKAWLCVNVVLFWPQSSSPPSSDFSRNIHCEFVSFHLWQSICHTLRYREVETYSMPPWVLQFRGTYELGLGIYWRCFLLAWGLNLFSFPAYHNSSKLTPSFLQSSMMNSFYLLLPTIPYFGVYILLCLRGIVALERTEECGMVG